MNTATNPELTEVAKSEVGAMALITLDPARYVAEVYAPFRAKLDAAKTAADAVVIDCSTTAGNAIAVKHRATFRDDVRLAVEGARTERKAPILMIGRLIDSVAKEITQEAAPYEARFDSAIKAQAAEEKARKDALIAAERARLDEIVARITEMRTLPMKYAGRSADEISAMIGRLVNYEIDASFEESIEDAKVVRLWALDELAKAETVQRGIEVQAESDRQEAARVAAQAKADREELAAAQAKLKADQAAQAEIARLAKEESDRAAAVLKAAQDEFNAKIAAHEAKIASEARAAQKVIDDAAHAALMSESLRLDKVARELAESRRLEAASVPAPEVAKPEVVEMVTITKAEYQRLLDRDDWLDCLEAAGVDNWSGFDDAREIQNQPASMQ